MARENARRGRPKGSGLNDRAELDKVRRLMAADPTLKATTAIKSLGINDPSTIRRLRDKLSNETQTVRPARADARTSELAAGPQRLQADGARSEAPGNAGDLKPVAHRETTPPVLTASGAAETTSRSSIDPTGWVTYLGGLGLTAIASSVEAQMMFFEHAMRLPHIAQIMRGQVLLNEISLAFCPVGHEDLRTLH